MCNNDQWIWRLISLSCWLISSWLTIQSQYKIIVLGNLWGRMSLSINSQQSVTKICLLLILWLYIDIVVVFSKRETSAWCSAVHLRILKFQNSAPEEALISPHNKDPFPHHNSCGLKQFIWHRFHVCFRINADVIDVTPIHSYLQSQCRRLLWHQNIPS